MFIQSFQKQVQKIFSKAAYKTSGLHIGCLSIALNQSPLSFKIDIAQKLYRNYEIYNFKFCEKGTTPRSIAQEIAIFTHQNNHYSFQIDSFGSITLSPTSLFYKKMKESILTAGKINHTLIDQGSEIYQIQKQTQELYIFYKVEDTSLSSLRLFKQLELYAKMKVKMNQYPNQKVKKIIDLTSVSLSIQQVKTLLKLQMFDIINFPTYFLLSKNANKDLLFLLQGSNFNVIYKWQRKNNNVLYTGCIRHKYIQFLIQTQGIVDQMTDQIIKIGQVFPDFSIQKLQGKQPQSKVRISKILNQCFLIDNLLPINLRNLHIKPHFPLTNIKNTLKGKTSSESILLLLQSISVGKVGQSLQFLGQARERGLFANQIQIYNIFDKNLSQLLF